MFSIQTHKLPTCSDFEGAMKVYNDAFIFRKHYGRLPNGARGLTGQTERDANKIVFMDIQGAVIFRLYQTDMVKWMSPTEVHVFCYDTRSSVDFANRFLPSGLSASGDKMRVNGYRAASDYLVFHKEGGQWRVVPHTVLEEHQLALDKKAAAQVRKVFTPFFEYSDALGALRQDQRFHEGRYQPETRLATARELFHKGHIPEESFPALYHGFGRVSPDSMPELYAVCGAIQKKKLPLGTVPRRTPYDNLKHLLPA